MIWGAYGAQNPSGDGIRRRDVSEASTGPSAKPQVKTRKGPLTMSAPSRIRTCAHGSGGRCSLP